MDLAVIGGGVVGLSIAWEASQRGLSVALFDRTPPGKQASWAGAGIIPAPPGLGARHPLDQLYRRASELHPIWAERLRSLTGIDTGFRRCGGMLLADRPGEAASLAASRAVWDEEQFEYEVLDTDSALARCPALLGCEGWNEVRRIVWTAGESQLRNPHHLQALRAALVHHRVAMHEQSVRAIERDGSSWSVVSDLGRFHAQQVCLAGGAWTGQLAARWGVAQEVIPIRGQMLLYRLTEPVFPCVLNIGPRYLVAREDGHLLVGSTEEEAGFDTTTTVEGIASLEEFASRWIPIFPCPKPISSWAGLRPASIDGYPIMGPVQEHPGLWVAAGHFRAGLTLSCATAQWIVNAMTGQANSIDARPFRPERGWNGVSAARAQVL